MMLLSGKVWSKLIFPILFLAIFAGCENMDEEAYRKQRLTKADKTFSELRARNLPEKTVLTLPFCIKTALANNLDMRVYDLKEAVSNERRTAAALGMLPDIVVTNDLASRNNEPGSSSSSLLTGKESLESSKSAERRENRVKVEFLFGVIDFGLAYLNSAQANDKALITNEEKRRAAQNLAMDVCGVFLKVAAAQYAMKNTEKMLAIADETESLLDELEKSKKVDLEKVINEKKTFLHLKKSLMEYRRSYENACIELMAMMGCYPKKELVVDTSCMKKMADVNIPGVKLLEEIALIERPELYQLDMQGHITALEARKRILEMFPNVGLFADFNHSSNKYLYNRSWYDMGVRAAYRLLRLPQKVSEYKVAKAEGEQVDAQVMAMSVGIISQVRIAHANLEEVKSRYKLAEELYDTYREHEKIKEARAGSAGQISKIELNRVKMEAAEKDILRTQTLGNYYLAYYRLLNAIGVESLDERKLTEIKTRIRNCFAYANEEDLKEVTTYRDALKECEQLIEKTHWKLKTLQAESSAIGVQEVAKTAQEEMSNCSKLLKSLRDERKNILVMLEKRESELDGRDEKLSRYMRTIGLLEPEGASAH